MKRYVYFKLNNIFQFSVLALMFSLVCYMENVDLNAILYAVAICVFVGVAFLLLDYYRYCRKLNLLRELRNKCIYGVDGMPRAIGGIECEYQAIIEKLFREGSEIVSEKDAVITDMNEFSVMWVHQIKTPIAAMKLLLRNCEIGETKTQMDIELLEIEQYVNLVLQYFRLGSDATDFIFQKQDLDHIIRGVVRRNSKIFIKKKISLNYETIDYKPVTDEKWLSFVIEQIISNGLKYTQKGEISIYIEDGTKGVLVIEDTGIGIQAEDLPRIFEKGYTGYNGRINRKSTGLGLYLCREIIGKMGHRIWAESVLGKGTKIKIDLDHKNVKTE